MTFAGKILVIVIMVFAISFLAISVAVFTTEKNWNADAQDLSKRITALKSEISARETELKTQIEALKTTKDDFAKQESQFKAQLAAMENDLKNRQAELEQTRSTVEKAQQTAKSTLAEANQHKSETDMLQELLAQVKDQAQAFSARQTELDNEIRILSRELETATANNKDLSERVR